MRHTDNSGLVITNASEVELSYEAIKQFVNARRSLWENSESLFKKSVMETDMFNEMKTTKQSKNTTELRDIDMCAELKAASFLNEDQSALITFDLADDGCEFCPETVVDANGNPTIEAQIKPIDGADVKLSDGDGFKIEQTKFMLRNKFKYAQSLDRARGMAFRLSLGEDEENRYLIRS